MADVFSVKTSPLSGNVYLLELVGKGEHWFDQRTFAALNLALDEVEEDPDAGALVVTNEARPWSKTQSTGRGSGEGKFFCNGVDLALAMKDPGLSEMIVGVFHKLIRRLLLFPMPLIAAICGHAVGGGCILALAHDYRFMSAERGFLVMNEVDNKLPLSPGLNALVQSKIPGNAFYKAVLCGQRFTAKSAVENGFVDGACPDAASTLEESLKTAKTLAARKFDRVTYKAMKMEMFKNQVRELDEGAISCIPMKEILARL